MNVLRRSDPPRRSSGNSSRRIAAAPVASASAVAAPGLPAVTANAVPVVGDVVAGKYRIEKVVGEGGMGIVYAAHHLVLDQRVALKLLVVDSLRGDETVERFVREAQAAASLRSEQVVRVTDAGVLDGGLPFLAMEYLQGCDLAELVGLEGPLRPVDAADYLLQVLAALGQAHAAGIVHRDLKPANLFLAVREDRSNIIKVLDFGISKQKSERARWKELTGQAVLGTPSYMSPEQLRSSKSVDARADIWSLGVVMYELLSGKLPFDGDGPGEIFAAVLEQTPLPLRAHRPELPVEWERIVMRCLQRSPEDRFAHVGQLACALAPLGSGRWAHIPAEIERALGRLIDSARQSGVSLVQAAVAAAMHSLPPPVSARTRTDAGLAVDRAPPRVGPGASLIGTDKTLMASMLSPPTAATRRRTAVWLATATAGALMLAGSAFTSRASSGVRMQETRAAGHAPLGAEPASRPVLVEWQSAPAASAPASPDDLDPSLHAKEAPPRAADEPAGQPAPATSSRRRQAAADAPRVHTRADPRPQFLKSWR